MAVQLVVRATPAAADSIDLREQRLAWESRRREMRQRPVARQARREAPLGRPIQPDAPVITKPISLPSVAAEPVVSSPSSPRPAVQSAKVGWSLTDRGLALIMASFIAVVVIGAAVVVNAALTFWAETADAPSVPPVAVAAAAQG